MAELLALAGADTLLGRELRDSLREHEVDVRLREINTPDDADFNDASLALLAAPGYSVSASTGATVVDATGAPGPAGSVLRAPMVENGVTSDADWQVIAHPAAIALTLFFKALEERGFIAQRAVVTAFEPASERGKEAVEEMQQQTMSLLAFKKLPQRVFDAQAVFNLLPRYGDDALVALDTIEARLASHVEGLYARAGLKTALPSLRLVHAPVFHGHAFSVWAEFNRPVAPDELERALAQDLIDVRTSDVEPPTNTGVAQQAGIQVGAIQFDQRHPEAAWFWLAADNIKLTADNASLVVKELAG